MILFLDFDGVLHPDINYNAELLMCNRPLLEDVLRSRPKVDVVISSTWREAHALGELQSLFCADIAPRIVGVTPRWREIQDDSAFGRYVRQAEIEAWLRSHNRAWQQWLAVDDQPHLFKPFCANLFATNPATGLTEADCEVLAQRLHN
ncbi:HAD domain-containing protein [Duganella sp. S19_KUP01_CR8]|uniref:HAD domain-containing protein n=1 Tax=Duganella sp. S19_KUP01_CR8 TaxID=3025502 RepID=UPI002FCD8F3A